MKQKTLKHYDDTYSRTHHSHPSGHKARQKKTNKKPRHYTDEYLNK